MSYFEIMETMAVGGYLFVGKITNPRIYFFGEDLGVFYAGKQKLLFIKNV